MLACLNHEGTEHFASLYVCLPFFLICRLFSRLGYERTKHPACLAYAAEKPLVLFLDSLDQLSGAEGAHQLTWFPVHLPDNVKVIASTLPGYYGLLDTLKIMIEDESSFIQV